MNDDLISLTPSIESNELAYIQAFTKVDRNGDRILEAPSISPPGRRKTWNRS